MKWCPNCKSEYANHIKKCNECGIDLIESLENGDSETNGEYCRHLINVANIHEANIIISLLSEYNIPAFYKSKESGEYLQIYTGFNIYGFDIYVPHTLINDAKDILTQHHQATDIQNEFDKEDTELIEWDKKLNRRNRIIANILGLVIVVIPLLIVLIFRIIEILD